MIVMKIVDVDGRDGSNTMTGAYEKCPTANWHWASVKRSLFPSFSFLLFAFRRISSQTYSNSDDLLSLERERIKNWEIITSRRLTTAFKNIFINKHIRLNPTLDCLLSERNNWFYNMFGHKTFICFHPISHFEVLIIPKSFERERNVLCFLRSKWMRFGCRWLTNESRKKSFDSPKKKTMIMVVKWSWLTMARIRWWSV